MRIIAVTGSSGFIGKHLVNALIRNKKNVIELDIDKGFNLLKEEDIQRVPKFDIIVHLAAKSFVPLSFEKPWEFYHHNYTLTLNVLELARLNNAKVIFVSSYLYGVPEYLPIDENHPLKPHNPYAQTKLICEKLCEGYNRDFNIPIIILRPFNLYGPGQNENFLLPTIIKQAKNGKIVLKDPRPKRDFVYIDDVANCFIKAIENDSLAFDIFNIGYGKSYSVQEIVEFVNHFYNNGLEIEYAKEERNFEVMDTVADVSKVRKVLGWTPKVDLFSGIKKLCAPDE